MIWCCANYYPVKSPPVHGPFFILHPIIHSTWPYSFSIVNHFLNYVPPVPPSYFSLSPKIILAEATSQHLFWPILSPSQQDIPQGILVTFYIKPRSSSLSFLFQFQSVSFPVPLHHCTSKMSHIIPSPDLNVTAPMFQAPPATSLSPESVSWIYLLDQGHLKCFISSFHDYSF